MGRSKKLLSVAVAAAIAQLAMSGYSHAATATWNNTGTDFNTGANWTGGTGTGGLPGTADNATFTGVEVTNPNLSAPLTIQGLTFSTAATSGYTLSSANASALTLTNTGNGATTSAISAANTSGTNTISENIILGGAAATAATFRLANGGALILSGNISSTNAITGLVLNNITNNQGETYTLSGNNTYSGNTTIGWLFLNINSDTALGNGTGSLKTSNTGTFDNTSGVAHTLANGITTTGSGNLTFKGTNNLTFNGADNFDANMGLVVNGGRLTLNGVVNFGTHLTWKQGAATLVLNNADIGAGGLNTYGSASYTAGMRLDAGTLEVGNSGAFGTGAVEFRTATLQSNTDLSGVNRLSNTFFVPGGTPTIGGGNNIELGGSFIQNNGASATTTVNVTNTGTTTLSGNVYLNDGTSATAHFLNFHVTGSPMIISGAIQNTIGTGASVGSLIKSGLGALTLGGASTYTGTTNIQNGTLQLTGALQSTNTLNLGTGTNSGKLILGGALGAVNQTFTNLTTTGTGTANAVVGGSTAISTLTINNGSNGTFAGSLGGTGTNENNLGFTKGGAGTLTINGTQTLAGATGIIGGRLIVSGSLPNSTVNVTSGIFDGTGSVNGIVMASSAANQVANGNGTTGGLTVGSLTFNGSGILSLRTSAANSAIAPLVVFGALTTTGANSLAFNLASTDVAWASGTYKLISYSSLAGSGLSGFNVPTFSPPLTSRQNETVSDNGSGLISLVIAGVNPTWSGAVNGNWDASTNNFVLPTSPSPTATAFLTGDYVSFDNTGANTTISISAANVSTGRVDFLSGTYAINGPFGIVGTGLVNIAAGSTVALGSPNGYSGGTIVTDANLNINHATALGTGSLTIAGTGLTTLDNTSGSPKTLTSNNTQAWNSNFIFTGSSDLNLGSGGVAMSATRTITVNAGTLTVGGAISETGGTGYSLKKTVPGPWL